MSLLIALALAGTGPAIAPPAATKWLAQASAESPESDSRIMQAFSFIQNGRPADGVKLLDSLIAEMEEKYPNGPTRFYCSRSPEEAILYAGMGAAEKRNTQVLDSTWCDAYFLKGYALIDLGRNDEAKTFLDKAIALAPRNSHFLGERAEWYKARHDWSRSYSEFKDAADAADFSPDSMKSFDRRRAWRGMAFVRIEQGQLEEAEKLLNDCLRLDPNDAKAKQELEYIRSLRRKST